MRYAWFKRKGFFFVPIALMGWVIVIFLITDLVYIFLKIDANSHSVSDTLINFAPRLLLIFALYWIVGYFTSKVTEETED